MRKKPGVLLRLCYRDLCAMMAACGISVSHTTIPRWVQHYVPEFERCCSAPPWRLRQELRYRLRSFAELPS